MPSFLLLHCDCTLRICGFSKRRVRVWRRQQFSCRSFNWTTAAVGLLGSLGLLVDCVPADRDGDEEDDYDDEDGDWEDVCDDEDAVEALRGAEDEEENGCGTTASPTTKSSRILLCNK